MITKGTRGFTLIEILIVVAIIAILASVVLVGLGPTQRQGRDARRISDLHQVQNGLELYYNHCGWYPGSTNCDPAAADYTAMTASLKGTASIGVSQVPDDPTAAQHYQYSATPATTPNTYVLAAQLEDSSNAAMQSSLTALPSGVTISGTCGVAGLYCISL
jgi:prepilin-type N-terminal cleavage/methylation domain-containing protein